MSHYEISYKGKPARQAINDLIRWFGLRKSILIIRRVKNIKNASNPIQEMNGLCFCIEMRGVQGEPVRRLFAHYLGEEMLKQWIES